jgi:hypothetical protein
MRETNDCSFLVEGKNTFPSFRTKQSDCSYIIFVLPKLKNTPSPMMKHCNKKICDNKGIQFQEIIDPIFFQRSSGYDSTFTWERLWSLFFTFNTCFSF